MTEKSEDKDKKQAKSSPPGRVWLFLRESGRFLIYAGRRFFKEDTLRVAASLSFTSLLAMVPLMVIGLAMLAAFPAFAGVAEKLQAFLFENFVPAAGESVLSMVGTFVEKAGGLTAFGIGVLGITALMLLNTIEKELNQIFKVTEARSVPSRILMYWTVLTLGPVLIGASFSLSGYLFAIIHFAGSKGLGQTVGLMTQAMPMLLAMLAFCLLYLLVPHRRVSVVSACIGALGAAVLFVSFRYAFTLYVTNITTYQTVYGAVSALPLFLIWLYLSWGAVLFGAVMAAAYPEWLMHRGREDLAMGTEGRLTVALKVIAALREKAREGSGLTRSGILAAAAVPEDRAMGMMLRLTDAGFVVRGDDKRWRLVRPLNETSLHALVLALGLGLGRESGGGGTAWRRVLNAHLREAEIAEEKALALTISELLGSK